MYEGVGEHYDAIAAAYNTFEEYNPRKHELVTDRFQECMPDLDGAAVIDLGCGSGFFTRYAERQGADTAIGVDVSREQLRYAREHAADAGTAQSYVQADITDLPVGRSFNVGIAAFAFSYASTDAELQAMADAAHAALTADGDLFAVMCNPSNPVRDEETLYRVTPVADGEPVEDGAPLRCEFYGPDGEQLCHDYKYFWSRQTIDDVLHDAGFTGVDWHPIRNRDDDDIPELESTNIVISASAADRS